MNFSYLVVEGPHDAAAIGKILTMYGLKLTQHISKVESFWEPIIPKKFPYKDDLLARVPVPMFYQSKEHSVAVHACGSDTKLISTLNVSLQNLDETLLSSTAIFCDADARTGLECLEKIQTDLAVNLEIEPIKNSFLSNKLGDISSTNPRTGIFIFPDNANTGNLEDILLQCAEISYPDLLSLAHNYVNSVDDKHKSEWKTSGERKVLVGCIANILKPGRANQVTIQDNEWICEKTIQSIGAVAKLDSFIKGLIF